MPLLTNNIFYFFRVCAEEIKEVKMTKIKKKKEGVEKVKEVGIEVPATAMADAIIKAAVEKQKASVVKATAEKKKSFLTAEQVENIVVKILTPEELAAAAAEAGERRDAAQALGKKLAKLLEALEQIYIVEGWEFVPKFKENVIFHEKQIENLQSEGDNAFQEQVRVALLFARIHNVVATEDNIRDFMNQIAQGRGNLCRAESFPKKENGKRDYGSNAVVFKENVLVPVGLDKDGRQNKTSHGLFTALRRLIERYYSEYEKEQKDKMNTILSQKASDNLEPLLDRKVNPTNKVGTYRINFPERRDNGKLFRAGMALFEVGFKGAGENPFLTIEVKDGGGSLADFSEIKGFWMDFSLLFAKELPEKITGKRRENTERVIRVFRAATYNLRKAFYEKKVKKESKKSK